MERMMSESVNEAEEARLAALDAGPRAIAISRLEESLKLSFFATALLGFLSDRLMLQERE
jgi:hypothetical protein